MNYGKSLAACGAVLIASVAVGLVASPVHAKPLRVVVTAPSPDQVTRRVSYRDLNLTLASDQRTLNRRVGSAVRYVCADSYATSLPFSGPKCRSYAWDGARPQIALAVERANQLAQTGSSSIAAVAITISAPE
jgi:UrcA family protein